MKLTPASRAFATIRVEVASSVGPPNIMVQRQIGEIFRPLRPRLRYCIGWVLRVWSRKIAARERHCEEQSDEAIHSFSLCFGNGLLRCARNDGNGGGGALTH